MKKRIIFIFAFILIITVFTLITIKIESMLNIPNAKKEDIVKYTINTIKEENDKYDLKAYVPVTEYEELNLDITNIVNSYIESFKNQLPYLSQDKKYYLNITFETYNKGDYISFLFLIKQNLGCLHDEKYISTINYDKKENKIITLYDLIKKDEELLNKLSSLSYQAICNNNDIDNVKNEDFIKEGTTPLYKNFENFIINKNSLDVYFNEYQVLPYYYGAIRVEIGYDEINLNI